ncbi:MAG TPA: diguanylate cyclase [Candidatus Eremiobacteraceae bacterium]|nr:diguanylate cyclase [Candidatus Eremiobacteraceae bacterium]
MDETRYQQLLTLTNEASLVFQIAGTALIAVLSFVVTRSLRYRAMSYWTIGWTCYAAALLSVVFNAAPGALGAVAVFLYYFLEYAAALSIFAACRISAVDKPPPRWFWYLLVPAAAIAGFLVGPPDQFFWRFAAHTALLGLLWGACFVALVPALRRRDSGPGVRIVAAGLILLSLDYIHHLPVALYLAAHGGTPGAYYYIVISIVDALLEFVLGFGTVVIIVDRVRDDLARANLRLELARVRTEEALHTDALTEAFSRYSFTATFGDSEDRQSRRGCIVMVDLDDLKHINDVYGHVEGDSAIRAVAQGLRSMIRQGDRVYRWGGDEFVVVMPDIPLDLAQKRMERLDEAINRTGYRSPAGAGALTVSWGAAYFDDTVSIKDAVASADAAMYAFKSSRKRPPAGSGLSR